MEEEEPPKEKKKKKARVPRRGWLGDIRLGTGLLTTGCARDVEGCLDPKNQFASPVGP